MMTNRNGEFVKISPPLSGSPSAAGISSSQKEEHLVRLLSDMKRVVVGYSGGVDSSYLAYMANRVLGADALCVTAISPSFPSYQKKETEEFVSQFGLNHCVVESKELDNPEYRENSPNRCYFCKSELFTQLQRLASAGGYEAILDGTNYDDLKDYRPGRLAASEFAVRSPLLESQMTKLFRFVARGLHFTVCYATLYGDTGRKRKRQTRILHLHSKL